MRCSYIQTDGYSDIRITLVVTFTLTEMIALRLVRIGNGTYLMEQILSELSV